MRQRIFFTYSNFTVSKINQSECFIKSFFCLLTQWLAVNNLTNSLIQFFNFFFVDNNFVMKSGRAIDHFTFQFFFQFNYLAFSNKLFNFFNIFG